MRIFNIQAARHVGFLQQRRPESKLWHKDARIGGGGGGDKTRFAYQTNNYYFYTYRVSKKWRTRFFFIEKNQSYSDENEVKWFENIDYQL